MCQTKLVFNDNTDNTNKKSSNHVTMARLVVLALHLLYSYLLFQVLSPPLLKTPHAGVWVSSIEVYHRWSS